MEIRLTHHEKSDRRIAQLPITGKLSARFLVIEDDLTLRPIIEHALYQVDPLADITWVVREPDAESMLYRHKMDDHPFDVVLTDVFLSGPKTGVDLWRQYRTSGSEFVIMSAITPDRFVSFLKSGEPTPIFFSKPVDPSRLTAAIRRLINR